MNATIDIQFRNIERANVTGDAGPTLRSAVIGAIVSQPRLELSYDWERGEYELGMTTAHLSPNA